MKFQAKRYWKKKTKLQTLEITNFRSSFGTKHCMRKGERSYYQESANECKKDASAIDGSSVDTNRVQHHVYLLLRSHEEGCAAKEKTTSRSSNWLFRNFILNTIKEGSLREMRTEEPFKNLLISRTEIANKCFLRQNSKFLSATTFRHHIPSSSENISECEEQCKLDGDGKYDHGLQKKKGNKNY